MGRKREFKLNEYQQKLVREAMPYAKGLANRYKNKSMGNSTTLEDLIQIALLGFCAAAVDYVESKGVKFTTYAWNRGEAYIKHWLRDKSRTVKVPRQLILDYYKYSKELEKQEEFSFSGEYLELVKKVEVVTPGVYYDESLIFEYEEEDPRLDKFLGMVSEEDLHTLTVWYYGHKMTSSQRNSILEIINRVKTNLEGY